MYYRTLIPLAGRDPEWLCGALAEFAVAGLEEQADAVVAYFDAPEAAAEAAAEFGGAAPEPIRDQNWSAQWQSAWQPILAGQRFFLCPGWMDVETPPGRVKLEMRPGNVFGGGDHATTQLCLEWLEVLVEPGCLIADIGAGTGILTEAARVLGARASGCDIDPQAMGTVDFLGSADALGSGLFDGVIANIHLGVLREIEPELRRICRAGGWLLLSGFLPEQADEAAEIFGPAIGLRELDGWCAAVFRLPG